MMVPNVYTIENVTAFQTSVFFPQLAENDGVLPFEKLLAVCTTFPLGLLSQPTHYGTQRTRFPQWDSIRKKSLPGASTEPTTPIYMYLTKNVLAFNPIKIRLTEILIKFYQLISMGQL